MPSNNHLKNIAIVGASGNSGKYMADALLATGNHTVTAITRASGNATLPYGCQVKKIDYDDQSSIVEALRGQDVLIITMGTRAPPEQEVKLTEAAGEAGVRYVFPNEWSPDTANIPFASEALMKGEQKEERRLLVEKLGMAYIAVSTGFWFEWSLAIPASYGFDFEKRSVTLIDEGETKITTSTWPQVGRAMASLLSLKIKPDGPDDKGPYIDMFKNKFIYVGSFTISQKDMLDSVLRVTDTTVDDWTITKQPAKERYDAGLKRMQEGDFTGFVNAMYTRVFYPDGDWGNFEKTRGLANDLLGLPKENLDEATKAAIKRSKEVKLW